MNRDDKRSRFAELARAYVSYQAARADLEIVEAVERSDALNSTDLDPLVESLANVIDIEFELRTAHFDHARVIVRFHMFDNEIHSHCTFWKPGEAGQVAPNTCLRDPAPDQLREWLNGDNPIGLAEPLPEVAFDDPLMALSGTLSSEYPDLADRHDVYLG